MAEPLSWILRLDSELGGATAFNKKLAETEARLAHADVATSKTERRLESTGQTAVKMGQDVGKATKQYVESLMSAGVPLERLEKLGHVLNGAGIADTAKAHHTAARAAGEHAAKTHEAAHAGGELRNMMRDATKVVGFKELSRAIDETKHSYVGMAEFAVGVLAFEGIKMGIELVSELGSEILKAAAQEERMGKVFENNLGVKGGKEAQEYAEKYAANTENSKEQTEGFAAELLRAGVPLGKLDMYMAAAGDVAAGSKNHIEGMTAAVAALSRATLSGKLEGRAMRGLGLGIPQMRELDEFKGKSDEELKGILEDGELTTNQVMRMIAGRDNIVGDKAVEMSKTLGAKLTHLSEMPDRYFEKFADSPVFEKIKGSFDHVLDGLDPNKQPGSAIFASLEGSVTKIVDGVAGIDFEHVGRVIADDVLPAMSEILSAANATAEVVLQMIQGMRVAKRFIEHPIDTIAEAANGGVDLSKEHQASTSVVGREAEGWWNAIKHPIAATRSIFGAGGEVAQSANMETAGPGVETASRGAAPRRMDASPQALSGQRNPYASRDPRADVVGYDEATGEPLGTANAGASALSEIEKELGGFERKGIDAAAGFAAGMSRSDEPARAGAAMGMSALDGLSSPAGQDSHSPSRKFARMGGYAADGYVVGIEDGEERAVRAAAGLAAAAAGSGPGGDSDVSQPLFGRPRGAALTDPTAPVTQLARGGAPAGDRKVEINMSFVINMGSTAPRPREADDLISKLRSTLPGILQPALESLAIEEGR